MPPSIENFIASLKNNNSYELPHYFYKREEGIPFYNGNSLRQMGNNELNLVKQEWADCWANGAGVLIISDFYSDTNVVDDMTDVMYQILEHEQADKSQVGDHFAKKGANKRIWNVLEKSAIENPKAFINYYSNFLLGSVCEAWLGPGFTMTAQVNLVPPNSTVAQDPHRDYHLGFQTDDDVARFPLHVQTMSAMLTLQGAIAHIDMPVESGPTRFLPYSQQYNLGYQIYRQDEFKAYFEEHAVQLPLKLGDAVFFNPALMHGAGANQSDNIQRLANLLQISSPFGVPMEMIDHSRIQLACYDLLTTTELSGDSLETLLTVVSDSYPFPTNLDRDIPKDSLTPASSKELLIKALDQSLNKNQFKECLTDYHWRRKTV